MHIIYIPVYILKIIKQKYFFSILKFMYSKMSNEHVVINEYYIWNAEDSSWHQMI